MSVSSDLVHFVAVEKVSDESAAREPYSVGADFRKGTVPDCVVRATCVEDVQAVLNYANERQVPITPRSSQASFYGASLPSRKGILLDLSGMNRILKIDAPDKRVMIEPGVTFPQLQAALGESGLQVCNPLLPHPGKSVLTSSLEREPILIPKSEYGETFLTGEVVLPTGERQRTGSAMGEGLTSGIYPDGLFPGTQLYRGAQGTLGIFVWANLKVEWLPLKDRAVFFTASEASDLIDLTYRLLRRQVGRECLILSRLMLASILADGGTDELQRSLKDLPEWTLILVLSGGHRLPDEKIAYELEAVEEVAAQTGRSLQFAVGSPAGTPRRLLGLLRNAWVGEPYWKWRYKGASKDIFFFTTLDQVDAFWTALSALAEVNGFARADLGMYVQPVEYGRACHCSLILGHEPNDQGRCRAADRLLQLMVDEVLNMGGFFSCLNGDWTENVYSQAGYYPALWRVIKQAYDPNNILNPGKLGV